MDYKPNQAGLSSFSQPVPGLTFWGDNSKVPQIQQMTQQANQGAVLGTNIGAIQPKQPSGSYSVGPSAADLQAQRDKANTVASYDDIIGQYNSQVGRLDPTLNTGLQNLASSYNRQFNRLGQEKAVAQRNYETQNQQNTNNYLQTRSGVMGNVRSQANALQRLLGMNGSGNSSAALEQAPYAAALMGTRNLTGAQQTYGSNKSGLETSWQDTQRGYKNALEDLDQDKFARENSLRASIQQTRAGLLEKIAGATRDRELARGGSYQQAMGATQGYRSQISSLLDQINQLGNQYQSPVLQAGNVAYKAPTLAGYNLGNNRPAEMSQPGAAGNVDPIFAPILADRERDEYGQVA